MKNAVAKWVAIVIAVILMLAVAAGAFFTLERFVVVEGHLYKRNESALDLREREVTCSAYDTLWITSPSWRCSRPRTARIIPSSWRWSGASPAAR